jgi:hypothetical protein
MLFGAKKWLICCFLKISILLDFVTNLIFKTLKNPPKNTNKEASDRLAIQLENASKFWNKRIIQKKFVFSSAYCPYGGGDEIRSLSMVQSDEIKPLQTVTSVWLVKISGEFKETVA